MRSSLAVALLVLSMAAPVPALADPLVGQAVGNADLLAAEGTRLYNEKAFDQARDHFLKAARVAPATVPTYLSLARAYFALKDLEHACVVYRVYVKNSSEGPDREKAQGELDLCERQLSATGTPPQLSQSYVSLKASFFEALDKGVLLGAASASELLQSIVGAGYAAPDLGDMAQKLARACEIGADATFNQSRSHQKIAPADLRRASQLYRMALDCGAAPTKQAARASFLEGLSLLVEGKAFQAETGFEDAAKRDPTDTEARFYRALAKYSSGDKAGALKSLETDLPNDPRTGVLRVALAMETPNGGAAGELVKFLYARKFQNVP
jgi:tetratricopeptide (TPR) repeat protein